MINRKDGSACIFCWGVGVCSESCLNGQSCQQFSISLINKENSTLDQVRLHTKATKDNDGPE